MDVIHQTQARDDRGVLLTEGSAWNRSARLHEIARYSFMDYFAAFVLPYLAKLAERFGLIYYGCCERIDDRVESRIDARDADRPVVEDVER